MNSLLSSDDCRTILVTGASGFVGAHLACGLAQKEHRILALGGSKAPCDSVANSSAFSGNLNLTVEEEAVAFLNQWQPDVIVHAAALARAGECEQNPAKADLINHQVTRFISDWAAKQAAMMIYISTDLVFDGGAAPKSGFKESDRVQPLSVYGKTKHLGELAFLNSGAAGAVLRVCLVYGSEIGGQSGFLGWIKQSLKRSEPVKLFTDEWRTPVEVRDIISVVDKLLHRGTRKGEIFHLGGPERLSRVEIGRRFAQTNDMLGDSIVEVPQDSINSAAPRPKDVSLCSYNICKELGLSLREIGPLS